MWLFSLASQSTEVCVISGAYISPTKPKSLPVAFQSAARLCPARKGNQSSTNYGGGIKRNPAIVQRREAALALLLTGQDAPSLQQLDAQHTSQQHPHHPGHPGAERRRFVGCFPPPPPKKKAGKNRRAASKRAAGAFHACVQVHGAAPLRRTQLCCTTVHSRARASGDPGPASRKHRAGHCSVFPENDNNKETKPARIGPTALLLANKAQPKPWSAVHGAAALPEARGGLVTVSPPCRGDSKGMKLSAPSPPAQLGADVPCAPQCPRHWSTLQNGLLARKKPT